MKENSKLTSSELISAIAFVRQQKNKYYKARVTALAQLTSELDSSSKLGEEELTKTQLRELVKLACNYMKCHSLYVYYRDSLTQLLVKKHGDINNSNSED